MTEPSPLNDLERFFPGSGEMATRMREFPWHASPLGEPREWPKSLATAVHICLTSRFPIVLWWGKDLRLLYNDAWRPVLGRTKHPAALGSPGREIWPEIWHIIGPMLENVMARGEATWSDDQLLPLDRNGYLEEAYFTYSYSPIPDEQGGVGGVFAAVNETTHKVLSERRLRTLRELAAHALQAKGAVEAARMAIETLAANRADVPFALLYLLDGDGRPRLEQFSPAEVGATDGRWPVAEAVAQGEPILLDRLGERVGRLPSPWQTPPEHAFVVPLRNAAEGRVFAVLVLGVNPARELDDAHRGFFEMAARHIATSVASASAYEEERRRGEALAELDRAKTAFFSNVSHEFRTPLTLMLGPVEDILAKAEGEVLPQNRAALEVVHRNGQRLLRLVNTLLDFARIEAGRAQASFEPVDLGALTADLASNFRSACERAGIELRVDCPAGGDPAYVDREMWEKIVLNLLSNAFKFTLEGSIAVSVRRAGGAFELTVRDTGSGIPAADLPRIFDRFHRVEGARGRSHEGSGIGLALVQELVRLHGGSIAAASEPGAGTTFTVSIPAGAAHLPPERIRAVRDAVSTSVRAGAFVDEALSWLPGDGGVPAPRRSGPRVLLADDNADLREYARRLLAERYDVEVVGDGEAALAAARARRPDLVVTDVMMPKLDGFGLIRELRADERLREVPVLALSARAGEEARLEGLDRGADDYLTKPFSARELLVRAEALLRSQDIRREALNALRANEQRYRTLLGLLPVAVYACDAPSGTITYFNEHATALWGRTPRLGSSDQRYCGSFRLWRTDGRPLPHDQTPMAVAIREGRAFRDEEVVVERPDGSRITVKVNIDPLRDSSGRVTSVINVFYDVSAQRAAEERLRRSEQELADFFETAAIGLHWVGPDGIIQRVNRAELDLLGYRREEYVGRHIAEFHADPEVIADILARLTAGERLREYPARMRRKDGGIVDVLIDSSVLVEDGKFVHTRCFTIDVTARKRAEESLRENEQSLRLALEAGRMGTWEWQIANDRVTWSPGLEALHGLEPDSFAGTFDAFRADIHPEDRATVERSIARTLNEGVDHHIQYRILLPDGRLRWIEGSGKLYRDAHGAPERMVGVCADITERKQSEHDLLVRARQQQAVASLGELALRERELQRLFEAATASVAQTLEVEYCKVLELMPGAEMLLRAGVGWREGLVGTARVGTGPDSQAGYTLSSGTPVIVRDLRTEPRFNGPPLLVEHGVVSGMSCIIRGPHGSPWGVLGTHTRRRVDFTAGDVNFLTAVANILSHAIERARAEEALRESDRSKDEFIAMLSHELRNPLAPLRTALDLLRVRGSAPDGELVGLMERQVKHLVRLVDDLLETSRISHGLIELRRERVALADVVRSAVEACEPLIHESGHRLDVSLPGEPLWLEADPVRLAQAISNLLNNAARYTRRGGHIWVRARREGAKATVSVRDTGAGFSPGTESGLFELFTRGAASSGLGIGLALVRRLAEMHGGEVRAVSEGVDRGAEFILTLPLAATPAAAAPPPPPAASSDGGGWRVLVADDNRDAADTLAMLLRTLGNEVAVAYDGAEAVEAARAFRPQVAMLDIGMPRLDGYEAARAIRAQESGRSIQLVALTGWGQVEDRQRAHEAGFDAHLVKPADLAALRRVLAEASLPKVDGIA